MGSIDRAFGGTSTRRGSAGGGGSLARFRGSGGGRSSPTAGERLDQAVEDAGETGDEGLFGFAKKLADRTGLDSLGNKVMWALDKADIGRAAVLSGLIEGADFLSEATGGKSTIEDTDRVQQTGASWDDFLENMRNRVGVGDVVEADPRTRDLPLNVKRGFGFLGDVAADPLTYLTGGAAQTAGGAVRGGKRALLSTDDVAESLIRAGDTEAAEQVLRGRSVAATSREALENVGVDRGVYAMRRFRIRPLDGVYDLTSRARGRVRGAVADQLSRRLRPETLERFERVPGFHQVRNSPTFQAEGTANVRAMQWALSWRDAGTAARNLKADYSDRLNDLFRRFNDVDTDQLRRELEAPDAEVSDAGREFRDFFDSIVNDVNEATGSNIPRLDNYLARVLTDEARAALPKGRGGTPGARPTFIRRRKLTEQTIEDVNESFLADAQDALRSKFGPKAGPKLFKDNPFDIANSYIDQVERFVRIKAFERNITEHGLAQYFSEGAVREALQGNRRALRAAERAARKGARAGERAEARRTEAEEIATDIQRYPFTRPAARRAADVGADLAEAEEQLDELAEWDREIEDEFQTLAEERTVAQAVEREAVDDPRAAVEQAQREVAELEEGRAAALEEQDVARAEAEQLQTQGPRLAEAVEGLDLTQRRRRLAQRLSAIIAEGERTGLDEARLQKLRGLAAIERGAGTAERQYTTEAVEDIATKMEQAMGLGEAPAPSLELAERITAARRRANAAGARATKADKAIARRLQIIDEAQATLETEFAVKGDMRPLLDENRARLDELRRERKGVSAARRRAQARERALRQRFEQLTAAAEAETDPMLAVHARLEAQAQLAEADAMARNAEAVTYMRQIKPIDEADLELLQAAAEDQIRKINVHGNLWADPDTADAFITLKEALKPRHVGSIMRMHDKVMARWKAWSLLSPSYHVRNGYSAMFMNSVAGYDGGATGYLRFGRFMRDARRGRATEALARIKDPQIRAAYSTMWENRGALFGGAVGTDVADVFSANIGQRGVLRDFARRGKKQRNLDPTALDFAPLKANMRLGEGVERMVRGPLYIDSLLKGMDPQQAYERVVRFHFNYSEGISQFERDVMRRIIPFYTWMRLNFPTQIEYMLRNPGVYTRYTHATRNLEQGTEEEQFVPSYLAELGAFRSPYRRGDDRVYVAPDLPFLRVGQNLDPDQIASSLTPIIKVPAELKSGERYFNDIPFSEQYQEVPSTWIPLAPVLEQAGGRLGLPNVEKVDGRYFFTNEAELYKAEQALPLLGRMRRLVPYNEKSQDDAFRSWLSFAGGITVLPNSPKQQENEMRRRAEEINDLVEAFNRRQEAAEA